MAVTVEMQNRGDPGARTDVVTANTMTVTTNAAHGGTHSLYGTYYRWTPRWGTTTPSGSIEVYQSWYQQLSTCGSGGSNCFYFGGGNFFLNEFKSSLDAMSAKIDWSPDSAEPWGSSSANLTWLPESGSPAYWGNRYMGQRSLNFDNLWHQWEVHFKANTTGCAGPPYGGCSDGILQVWRDGVQLGNFQNVNLVGQNRMQGMEEFISGTIQNLLWLNGITGGQAQCDSIIAAGPPLTGGISCSSAPGTGYGCTTGSLNFDQINAFCSGQAPPAPFNKYIDDVIVLYK